MENILKKNEIIRATAIDLDFKGQGVVKYNDVVVFVKGLLKDEEAKILITKVKKSFATGVVKEIIKPAPNRKCETSNLGSLDLMHLEDAAQVKWQEDITKQTFEKILEEEVTIDETIKTKETSNYRNKVVFHVVGSNPLKLGLYNTGFKLVEVNDFILANPLANKIVKTINEAKINLENNNLKHVVIRNNNKNELMVILVVKRKKIDLSKVIKILKETDEVVSMYINISPSKKYILGHHSIHLNGLKYLSESYNNTKVLFNDASFLQTNYKVANKLYDVINKYVDSEDTVIDAYSGSGSIGLSLANKVRDLYLLEINADSIKMMKNAIKLNKYNNIGVYKGDVIKTIDNLDANTLITDPPRSGMSDEFIKKIREKAFKTIIYISCNITSQARDINALKDMYDILKIHPIKMFYQTTATENLVILKRK